MAREVVSWCDRCLERGEHTPAAEVRFGLDGQWWSADLCLSDEAELFDAARKVIASYGTSVKTASAPLQDRVSVAKRAGKVDASWAPTIAPNPDELRRLENTLERSRQGKRSGRPPSRDLLAHQLPCPFCGLILRDGFNGPHLRIHGYSSLQKAFGASCPYCGVKTASLGQHLQGSHEDKLHSRPTLLVKELFEAHIAGADFDMFEEGRSRAYGVQPLSFVMNAYNECVREVAAANA
jgi:hypothetical protein